MVIWLYSQTETQRVSQDHYFIFFLNWIKETSHHFSPAGEDKSEGRQ